MRLSTSYAVAFSLVQSTIAALNRVPPVATQMDFFGFFSMVFYMMETMVCSPWGCNGIQPYEWVAVPLFILATFWFVGFMRVGRF